MTQNNTFENVAARNEDRNRKAWDKNEKKLARIKRGLIAAAVAQAILLLIFILESNEIYALDDFLFIIYLISTVAAYVIGGGIGAALKRAWGITKKLFVIGWLCVPFPMDIFSGLFTSIFGFAFLPMGIIMMPLLMVFLNYRDAKKEQEELEYNILCSTPGNTGYTGAEMV